MCVSAVRHAEHIPSLPIQNDRATSSTSSTRTSSTSPSRRCTRSRRTPTPWRGRPASCASQRVRRTRTSPSESSTRTGAHFWGVCQEGGGGVLGGWWCRRDRQAQAKVIVLVTWTARGVSATQPRHTAPSHARTQGVQSQERLQVRLRPRHPARLLQLQEAALQAMTRRRPPTIPEDLCCPAPLLPLPLHARGSHTAWKLRTCTASARALGQDEKN